MYIIIHQANGRGRNNYILSIYNDVHVKRFLVNNEGYNDRVVFKACIHGAII